MSLFGKSLVPYQTQILIKRDRKLKHRRPVNYPDAEWIGILYSVEGREKHDAVIKFVEDLELEGKKVDVLTFLPKGKDNYDFKFDFFSEQHIGLLGQIKAPNVKEFVGKKFDLLFYLDYQPNPYLEPVLAMSQAKCRVGRKDELTRNELFELMVKLEKGPISELINKLHHYAQVFATHE